MLGLHVTAVSDYWSLSHFPFFSEDRASEVLGATRAHDTVLATVHGLVYPRGVILKLVLQRRDCSLLLLNLKLMAGFERVLLGFQDLNLILLLAVKPVNLVL
jgi:hypothetical protein